MLHSRMPKLALVAALSLPFAAPAASQTGCRAECPAHANCVGSCLIEAPEGSTCSAVCTAGCAVARCQLFGAPECSDVDEQPCERRPGKRRSGQPPGSPLATPWAILEIDEAGELSPAARGVLAASTAEFGRQALVSFWAAERDREDHDPSIPAVRKVFWVAPTGIEPVEHKLRLGDPRTRLGLPPATRFYFRAATDDSGRVVAVERLYASAEESSGVFIGFIKNQYRVESSSGSVFPIFFHGRITVDGNGQLIRSASALTRLSAADLELFRQLAE